MSKRRNEKIEKAEKVIQYKYLEPKTLGQKDYYNTIIKNDITICSGESGTGKTAIAVSLAAKAYNEHLVSNIIVTRPTVSTGKGLGFLPGAINEKMSPYLIPIYQEFRRYYKDKLNSMIGVSSESSNPIIEIAPFDYLRGRSFHNSFVILDEAQNATYDQLKMFITRFGDNCKMVINGDTKQCDLEYCDLEKIADKISHLPKVGWVELTTADVVRNDLVKEILRCL